MRQTAVDWLFKELCDRPKDKMVWYYILEKAKRMERKQIISAHAADRIFKSVALEEGIDYYKETYGDDT